MEATQLLRHRLNNALHALLLLGGLGGLLMAIGWVLEGPTGLLWAGGMGLAALLLSPRVSPALILRMYRARPLAPLEAPRLYELVARLARQAELPRAPVLFYVPTPVMNAFSVGRRHEAVIAVTDGLLRGLPPRELAAVLAHELAHVRHNDMWIMSLADAVSRIVRGMSLVGQLLVLVNLPMLMAERGPMPWLPIVLLVFAPSLSALLQLALSRNREFDADLEAAHLTGDPLSLAAALDKMELQQERLWQHVLWPGYRRRQPALLRTHPNSGARIARLRTLVPAPPVTPVWELLQDFQPPGIPTAPLRPRHRWHGLWL